MAPSQREQTGDPADEVLTVSGRRRRGIWVAVLGIALASGSALLAVPAIASGGSPDAGSSSTPHLAVCESGVIDHGDGIQTSTAAVERVTADAPVADDCTAP
jgi:hypothetical protein